MGLLRLFRRITTLIFMAPVLILLVLALGVFFTFRHSDPVPVQEAWTMSPQQEALAEVAARCQSVTDICDEVQDMVCKELSFAPHPIGILGADKANSVGYSALMVTALNHAFSRSHPGARATQVRGNLSVLGYDLSRPGNALSSLFGRHDWVMVTTADGDTLMYDPAVHELCPVLPVR